MAGAMASWAYCSQPLCAAGLHVPLCVFVQDCGGTDSGCPRCVAAQLCRVNADCVSGLVCDPSWKACVTPSCLNGIKDGDELCVDPGGSCIERCSQAEVCAASPASCTRAPFVAVSTGQANTCGLRSNGSIQCFGELEDWGKRLVSDSGWVTDYTTYRPVPAQASQVAQVSVARNLVVVRRGNGTVECYGYFYI